MHLDRRSRASPASISRNGTPSRCQAVGGIVGQTGDRNRDPRRFKFDCVAQQDCVLLWYIVAQSCTVYGVTTSIISSGTRYLDTTSWTWSGVTAAYVSSSTASGEPGPSKSARPTR